MKWFLNLIYAGLLLLLSPVILWRAIRHGRYRAGLKEKVFGALPESMPGETVVWFHAVSVGEVLQLEKLIDAYRKEIDESLTILVTSSTDTGYQLALERLSDCRVSWFPLDFSWAVSRALSRVNPSLVVLVELELWPNFLQTCHRRAIPMAIVNARMSERSFRGYTRIARVISPLIQPVSAIVAQNDEYADRLIRLGACSNSTTVSGSIKFDQVCCDRNNAETLAFRSLFDVSSSDLVFMAGSTQDPEERVAVAAWKQLRERHPELRLILIPRHRERFDEVVRMVRQSGCMCVRRSELSEQDSIPRDAVIVLDTIGELSACWGLADIALVGGSFGSRGGQNMLEPAAFGASVMVGPNTWNFREIVRQLDRHRAIVRLKSTAEVLPQLTELLTQPERRIRLGRNAQEVVVRQQGALQKTISFLLGIRLQPGQSAVADRQDGSSGKAA